MAEFNGLHTYLGGEAANAELGLMGFDRISAADPSQTGNWIKIVALDAVTFTVGTTAQGDDLASGDTLAAGDCIRGPFTEIDLSAGTVLAYRG